MNSSILPNLLCADVAAPMKHILHPMGEFQAMKVSSREGNTCPGISVHYPAGFSQTCLSYIAVTSPSRFWKGDRMYLLSISLPWPQSVLPALISSLFFLLSVPLCPPPPPTCSFSVLTMPGLFLQLLAFGAVCCMVCWVLEIRTLCYPTLILGT